MKNKRIPVFMFDIGNTIAEIGHADYVRSVDEKALEDYNNKVKGSEAIYEEILSKGFEKGDVNIVKYDGVNETFGMIKEVGDIALFSTYPEISSNIILEQIGASQYPDYIFSTFDFNKDGELKSVKTVNGFNRVEESLRSQNRTIKTFADDKIEELLRARQAYGNSVELYKIGKTGEKKAGINRISSISGIPLTTGDRGSGLAGYIGMDILGLTFAAAQILPGGISSPDMNHIDKQYISVGRYTK